MEYKKCRTLNYLRRTDERTDGQMMANSIVPLPHFVRRGTKRKYKLIPEMCDIGGLHWGVNSTVFMELHSAKEIIDML